MRVDECVAINAEIPLGVGRCVADDARRIRSTPGLEVALREVERDRCRSMSVSQEMVSSADRQRSRSDGRGIRRDGVVVETTTVLGEGVNPSLCKTAECNAS